MSKSWNDFKKYLFEVLAIITAITLSFLFDEWREKRRDRRDSIQLLSSIAENLKTDTTNLRLTLEFQEKLMAGEKHILLHADSLRPDSVTFGLLAFQTYPTFRRAKVAYLTMVQTGQSRVVENQKLLNQVNHLYQVEYEILDEWTDIQRRTVLEKNIPYVNTKAPYVKQYNYASLLTSNNKQFQSMLKENEFRNLIHTDFTFKSTLIMLYKNSRTSIDSLLRNVNAEIKKLKD